MWFRGAYRCVVRPSYGLTAVLAIGALVVAPASAATLRVTWNDGRLTVAAEGVRRAEVLHEIARLTNVVVEGLEAIPDEPVSVHFRNVSLREGLRRLLADIPAVVIEESLVDGRLQATVARVFGQAPERDLVDGPETAGRLAALRAALGTDDLEAALTAFETLAADNGERAIEELLVAARAGDGRIRLQALEILGNAADADSRTVLGAFVQALDDDDEAVRAHAIDGIAVRGGADGEHILREALRTANVDMKLAVIDSIGQRGGRSPLLEESLADDHPHVRAAAESWLAARSDALH